eukprot:GHVS01003687.1.p2 GENE.GHVS01003687.1~~GHVS01003687.1.p2  ORF type:complete len:115 (+),score=32.41 GHVS01003687.1:265-609(+)
MYNRKQRMHNNSKQHMHNNSKQHMYNSKQYMYSSSKDISVLSQVKTNRMDTTTTENKMHKQFPQLTDTNMLHNNGCFSITQLQIGILFCTCTYRSRSHNNTLCIHILHLYCVCD